MALSEKRVFTLQWSSTNRVGGSGNGTKYDYTVDLGGQPWLALREAPKAYRCYLSTVGFWGGPALTTSTSGMLNMKISTLSFPNTSTTFNSSRPAFVLPLTATKYVDQNGIPRQPLIIAPIQGPQLHVSFTLDDSTSPTDLLDHTVVLTLEPIYED